MADLEHRAEFEPETQSMIDAADVHAEHLAPAVGVDADRDDHRSRADAAVVAHLHVGRVDPQVRPVAFERPIEERPDPRVELFDTPAMPSALTRSSTERVEMPWM